MSAVQVRQTHTDLTGATTHTCLCWTVSSMAPTNADERSASCVLCVGLSVSFIDVALSIWGAISPTLAANQRCGRRQGDARGVGIDTGRANHSGLYA